MRFVVVTGMSGGGKTTVMKMLEDAGYYCVDNLPISLLEQFVEFTLAPGSAMNKVALGIDVRAGENVRKAVEILSKLKKDGYTYEILFLDASDETLQKRYKETRRQHPIASGERIESGIRRERELMQSFYSKANYIIDTSSLLTRELREEINRIFVQEEAQHRMLTTVLSFGFKHGIPADADIVFDVRFLDNPYYVEGLKHLNGNDEPVREFLMNIPQTGEFLDKFTDTLQFLIPNYIKQGKYRLVIAIGCTGGKHRSVALANALFDRLKALNICGVTKEHRDILKDR